MRSWGQAGLMLGLILTGQRIGVSAGVVDRIAVIVGKDVITESEVDEEVRITAFLNQQPLDLGAESRRDAADRLVDQDLIRSEMQIGSYPQPSDSDVDATERRFRQEHFGSAAQYRAGLAKYGITEEQVKAHLRWQLSALRFTEARFQPGMPPPPVQSSTRLQSTISSTSQSSASREAPDVAGRRRARGPGVSVTVEPPAQQSSTDDQMEAWLKEARSQTRVEFKKGVFE